jgi:hypothetical protein
MAKVRKRWIAKEDSVVKQADGQVYLVHRGEIVLADKAPSKHFEPAGKQPGEPVLSIAKG